MTRVHWDPMCGYTFDLFSRLMGLIILLSLPIIWNENENYHGPRRAYHLAKS